MLAIITIPWRHQTVARTSHEGALYAALDVIGGGNPALAQTIHDARRPPPFSAHLADGLLRIGCLTTEVFLAVAESKAAYKATREREDSFDTILARAADKPAAVALTFVTPTVFAHDGGRHVLPDPAHVFGSLVRRWSAGGGLRLPEMGYEAVAVTYATITGRKRTLERQTVCGFTGRVVYRVPAAVAVYFHALADFANYAGIGKHTSQGFGRVEYDQQRGDARRSPAALPDGRADAAAPVPG